MSREDIEKILEVAVFAPSGDNSQPWRFVAAGEMIQVFSLPEKDNIIFNYHHRGTLFAHGALIENITITAKEFGYRTEVTILPDKEDLTHTADVVLIKDQTIGRDPLFDFIKKRITNRKFYKNLPLSEQQKLELENSVKMAAKLEVIWAEGDAEKKELGKAVAVNEIVMLEFKELHDAFYHDVRWTRKAERTLKNGLYLRTMEFALPQLAVFKLLQFWPLARILNRLKIARFIASENAKLYSSAGAIGIIPVEDRDEEFIGAGMAMQRLWLRATQLGLAVHMVTGVVYLAQRIVRNEPSLLPEEHTKLVRKAYNDIADVFPIGNKVVASLFRVGLAPAPSDYSSRLKPEIKYL